MLKDKEVIKFDSPEEMLDYITSDSDLYNLETGDYIWRWNDYDSIAVDNFSIEEAERLEQEATKEKTYWGGLVPGGARIYDSQSYYDDYLGCTESDDESSFMDFDEDELNLDYCREVYNKGIWIDVTH